MKFKAHSLTCMSGAQKVGAGKEVAIAENHLFPCSSGNTCGFQVNGIG